MTQERAERIANSLGRVLLLLFGVGLLVALLLPARVRPIGGNHGQMRCSSNLRQLNSVLHIYAAKNKGFWPTEQGEAFWLKFQTMTPPLIDPSMADLYFCPLLGDIRGVGSTDYRGPAVRTVDLREGDPLGADKLGNHGLNEGGNVLRASGDVMPYNETDTLWLTCATGLSP